MVHVVVTKMVTNRNDEKVILSNTEKVGH
jgi:hypothetical protein